jgi:hypothetical protein
LAPAGRLAALTFIIRTPRRLDLSGHDLNAAKTKRMIIQFLLSQQRSNLAGDLTIRLSDAQVRRRKTKLIYPNHRLPSLAHRRRDPAIARTDC